MTTLASAAMLAGRFGDAAAAISDELRGGVAVVRGRGGGGGSGTVWRSDGLVITNNHVATGESAEVAFADGRTCSARVVARDPSVDLAALQVEDCELTALPTGDSAKLHVGQIVIAVGNPLGETRAVTAGIISGVGGGIAGGRLRLTEAVQANITLLPGNSGGPLADVQGRVVGINAMVMGPRTALAVPSATVRRLLGGRTRRVLGVQVGPVRIPAAIVARHGLGQEVGLLLLHVEPERPAARAGLLPGDILLALDGKELQEPGDLSWGLSEAPDDMAVVLRVLRGGEPLDVEVAPQEHTA